MIVAVSHLFFRLVEKSTGNKFYGLTLWPFIVVRDHELKIDKPFMNHERIHLRQQLEMLVLPFYVWYGLEFLCRWIWCGNGHEAYRNISFEREAYGNEDNLNFLRERKFFGFWKYI